MWQTRAVSPLLFKILIMKQFCAFDFELSQKRKNMSGKEPSFQRKNINRDKQAFRNHLPGQLIISLKPETVPENRDVS